MLKNIRHLSFSVSLAQAKYEPSITDTYSNEQAQAILEEHNASFMTTYYAEDMGSILKLTTIRQDWDAQFAQVMDYISKQVSDKNPLLRSSF